MSETPSLSSGKRLSIGSIDYSLLSTIIGYTQVTESNVIVKRDGNRAVAIDADDYSIISSGTDHAQVILDAIQYKNSNLTLYLKGDFDVGRMNIQFPPGVNIINIIGTGRSILRGNIIVDGGVLLDTRGLFRISDLMIIVDEDSSEPGLEVNFVRNFIGRNLIVVTSDVNLDYNNLAPTTRPNNAPVGIRLNDQSGEQTILENVIVSGFRTGIEYASADHVICYGCESRFTEVGFRVLRGFDFVFINPHSFNGYGDARMMVIGDSESKPFNVSVINFHDENCQSEECTSRATFEIARSDTYINIDGGYISTSEDHVLLLFPSGYRSWAGFVNVNRVYASNPVRILARGQDGDLELGTHRVQYIGYRFSPLKVVDYSVYDLLGLFRYSSTSTTLGSGTTTLISEAGNNHGHSMVIVLVKINANENAVQQDINVAYRRSGPGGVLEVERIDNISIQPGDTVSTFFVDAFDRSGYTLINVTTENVGVGDSNVTVDALLLWLK